MTVRAKCRTDVQNFLDSVHLLSVASSWSEIISFITIIDVIIYQEDVQGEQSEKVGTKYKVLKTLQNVAGLNEEVKAALSRYCNSCWEGNNSLINSR